MIKDLLISKQLEYEKKIKKLKRKKKITQILYFSTMVLSISCATITSATLAGIPVVAVSVLGIVGLLSTTLSVKFNLKKINKKLHQAIKGLERVKTKIQFLVAHKNSISEEQHLELMKEFDAIDI